MYVLSIVSDFTTITEKFANILLWTYIELGGVASFRQKFVTYVTDKFLLAAGILVQATQFYVRKGYNCKITGEIMS